jgi:endonuclease YncB( thermonuclease family)
MGRGRHWPVTGKSSDAEKSTRDPCGRVTSCRWAGGSSEAANDQHRDEACLGAFFQRVEFAISCAIAFVLVAAWFQWAPAEMAAAASPNMLEGRAIVIDGDTIEIHGERVRILDIDAPESRQTCTAQDGSEWRCGQKAALALSDWIGAKPVTCATTEKDQYGRWLSRCSVDGADMAGWLARYGWAVPYRDCKCEVVRTASDAARNEQAGIWTAEFQMPWEWRAADKAQAASPLDALGSCVIKGNISKSGERIFHVPGNRYYDKTIIDERSGERWFCSESEAIAAGWRPAKVQDSSGSGGVKPQRPSPDDVMKIVARGEKKVGG